MIAWEMQRNNTHRLFDRRDSRIEDNAPLLYSMFKIILFWFLEFT